MRHSLAAPSALLISSVCAGLSIHTAFLFAALRGADASALTWPFAVLGSVAVLAGIWMGAVGWTKQAAPLRWRALAPRSFALTTLLSAGFGAWFFALADLRAHNVEIWAGTSAAFGYWLVLAAVTPPLTNQILGLPTARERVDVT